MNRLGLGERIGILLALTLLVAAVLLSLDPLPQDPGYHRFADDRKLLGIPNLNDVVSNLAFVLVGALGLVRLFNGRLQAAFHAPSERRPYLLFFAALLLVGLGSTYYHLLPSNERLFWDRLPIATAFLALCAAVVADRIDARAGNGWLLLLLTLSGGVALGYWIWSEWQGQGDLRGYIFIQFYPLLALPLILWLFPRYRICSAGHIGWIIFWYGVAKGLELSDRQIYGLFGQILSGHTLKHLAAALAALVVLRMLQVAADGGKLPLTAKRNRHL
ncbi:MAG: hypothetical protein KDI68_10070 [Gammaproteobacteria bacterium]|nr:hypothetical protein [Gammaproteobacteria bacterium]